MMQNWKAGSRGTQVVEISLKENEEISSFCVDDQSQSVFFGTIRDCVHQVDLRSKKKIKKYSGFIIGSISYLSSFNNLLFVGSNNTFFSLISIRERRILTVGRVETLIKVIKSANFTILNRNDNSTVSLVLSGCKSLLLYLMILIIK